MPPSGKGHVAHEFHHTAADGRQLHLNYTADLSDDGVVNLDTEKRVEHVVCEADMRTVIVTLAGSTTAADVVDGDGNFLGWQPRNILVGGIEWGCRNADGSPGALMRRIVSGHPVPGSTQTLRFNTTAVGPQHVFKNLNAKFSSNQFPGANTPQTLYRPRTQNPAPGTSGPATITSAPPKVPTTTWHVPRHSRSTRKAADTGPTGSPARRLGFFSWLGDAVSDVAHGIEDVGKDIWNGVKTAAKTVYTAGKLLLTGGDTLSKSLQLAAINFNYNPTTDASDKAFSLSNSDASVAASCSACHVYADLTLHVEVKISDYELTYATAALEGTANINMEGTMTAELGATYSHSLHVATITLPTVTIPLGPVPLAVTMSVPIEAGFSATLEANGAFKMNSASSGSLTYGFEYTPSGGLEWLHENTMTHVAPPVPGDEEVTLEVSLWVKPALSLSVDKIASVSVDVKPQLNVVITASDDEASCPNQRPADSFGAALDVNLGWNLAVQISAGINIGIFSYSLYSHTWGPYNLIDLNGTLFNTCLFVGDSDATDPDGALTPPSSAAGSQVSAGVPPYVSHVSSAGTTPAKQNDPSTNSGMFNSGADPYGDDDDWRSSGGLYDDDSYDDDFYNSYYGDDDYYRRRRLKATPQARHSSTASSRHLAVPTSATATGAVSSTGGFQVVGPKRCASDCVIASGLTTCPWLNGSPVCSSLSHDDLLKLDASIAKSAKVWRSQGPACADTMIPYLCSLHIPRCSVNASANATVNATSAVQPSRRGAQAGGSVLEAMPVDTCFHAHSVCGTQPSVARSLCHSCKGNRYCPLSATSLDNLTPPVPINATGSKSGQCLVPSSADVPFCTHVAGTSVFLRTDLYPTARVADKFARAVVAQSANGASTCLKAIKTLACATMLPPCTASAAKTSDVADDHPAPMCFDTCLKVMATCQSEATATTVCTTLVNRTLVLPQSSPLCETAPPATPVNVDAVSVGVDPAAQATAGATPSSSNGLDNIDWTSAAVGAGSMLIVGVVAAVVAVVMVRSRSRARHRGRGGKRGATPDGRDVVTHSPTYMTTVEPRARVNVEMTGIVPSGPLSSPEAGDSSPSRGVMSPSRSLTTAAPSTSV